MKVQRPKVLVGFLLGAIFWLLLSSLIRRPVILPSPISVAFALWKAAHEDLSIHLVSSFRRVGMGFGVAVAAAIPLGVALGASPVLRSFLEPILEVLRPIPAVAWLPVLLVIFGASDGLSISIVCYAAFFPILLNTVQGVRDIDRAYVEAMQMLGATWWQRVRCLYIPGAAVPVLTGIRLGLTFAWMSIVAAELIGASAGIGYKIMWHQKMFSTTDVIACMVVIGLIGHLLDRLLLVLQQTLTPWGVRA